MIEKSKIQSCAGSQPTARIPRTIQSRIPLYSRSQFLRVDVFLIAIHTRRYAHSRRRVFRNWYSSKRSSPSYLPFHHWSPPLHFFLLPSCSRFDPDSKPLRISQYTLFVSVFFFFLFFFTRHTTQMNYLLFMAHRSAQDPRQRRYLLPDVGQSVFRITVHKHSHLSSYSPRLEWLA